MTQNLKIIISGGSKGIGKDFCDYFLKKNYKILCLSRTKPKIKNKNLLFLKIDLKDNNDLEKKKKLILKFNPKILINNSANIGSPNYFKDINFKKWQNSFFLNFFAHAYLTKILIKKIIKNKGKIIFLAGGGAANAFPKFSSYSIAKTAIVRLAENIAAENYNKLDCYAISPGPVKTNLLKKFLKMGHKVKKNLIISSDEFLKLTEFLIKTKDKSLNGRYIHSLDPYNNFTKKNIKNNLFLRRTEFFKNTIR